MKKNLFRSRLFLCAPAAFCLCAALLCACSAQGNAVPASAHEQALAQLKAQDAELQALTEQVAELKAALADAQRAAVWRIREPSGKSGSRPIYTPTLS